MEEPVLGPREHTQLPGRPRASEDHARYGLHCGRVRLAPASTMPPVHSASFVAGSARTTPLGGGRREWEAALNKNLCEGRTLQRSSARAPLPTPSEGREEACAATRAAPGDPEMESGRRLAPLKRPQIHVSRGAEEAFVPWGRVPRREALQRIWASAGRRRSPDSREAVAVCMDGTVPTSCGAECVAHDSGGVITCPRAPARDNRPVPCAKLGRTRGARVRAVTRVGP